jgi:hypothetical protein
VRMRRRKPWVLARRRLFGWKVRLLTLISVTGGPGWSASAGGGGPCVGRNRKPASTSRACENGRPGRVYRTRAPATGSNQPMSAPADPRIPVHHRPDRPRHAASRQIVCCGGTNFVDPVAGVDAMLLTSPFGAPTVITHRLWISMWTAQNGLFIDRA